MHMLIFVYVYMYAKVYEDRYVYSVLRVVQLFLYMRDILFIVFIDLRSAQVYCNAIFLVGQEVYLNFHHFCG